jgi:hypothetical protein
MEWSSAMRICVRKFVDTSPAPHRIAYHPYSIGTT